MIWLGLDPATHCGWAHSGGDFGTWTLALTGEHCGRKLTRFAQAIRSLHCVKSFDRIAYEDAGFASPHARDVAAFHAELRGVIKFVSEELGLPDPLPINPMTLKKWATGYGKATKQQMMAALDRLFRIKTTDDNAADAIFVLKFAEQHREIPGATNRSKRMRPVKERKLFT